MQIKNPTRAQKKLMAEKGLDPNQYQVVSDTFETLVVQHRETGKRTMIPRSHRKRKWPR